MPPCSAAISPELGVKAQGKEKMFAEKRVVIVAAVVLMVCGLLFCNAAPAVEAVTPTTLTVTASTTTPAVSKPFTLSGVLTDKSTGTPLSGKTIRLQREDPSGHWEQAVNTSTTNANGAYSFTVSESVQGNYRFQPTFDGAGSYASAYVLMSITVGTLA